VEEAVAFLKGQVSIAPTIGIICGSGLGGLADLVEDPTSIGYQSIPNFPTSTVAGHEGKLVFGTLGGAPVVVMKGRLHCYEGYSFSRVAVPIRTLCNLGINYLLVTNAAGGLNEAYNVGDLMMLEDHLNFPGFACQNPLVGPHDDRYGPRFVPMSKPYHRGLRTICEEAIEEQGLGSAFHKGVYAMLGGPTYETPAEARFVKAAGADAVGMSTVPEVIVAVQQGVKCMAMSLITNKVVMKIDDDNEPNHEEVLAASKARQGDVQALFVLLCSKINAAHAAGSL
jgi:purine-nucleoside phosphorylase